MAVASTSPRRYPRDVYRTLINRLTHFADDQCTFRGAKVQLYSLALSDIRITVINDCLRIVVLRDDYFARKSLNVVSFFNILVSLMYYVYSIKKKREREKERERERERETEDSNFKKIIRKNFILIF